MKLSKSDRNTKILENMGLGHKIIHKYNVKDDYFDNIRQEGYLALCRAVDGFDCAGVYMFSTYAEMVIKRHLNRYIAHDRLIRPHAKTNREPYITIRRIFKKYRQIPK